MDVCGLDRRVVVVAINDNGYQVGTTGKYLRIWSTTRAHTVRQSCASYRSRLAQTASMLSWAQVRSWRVVWWSDKPRSVSA